MGSGSRYLLCCLLSLILTTSACLHSQLPGNGGDIKNANATPVADAGPDRQAVLGSPIILNGEGSSDLEGSRLSYHWEIVTTPDSMPYQLENPTDAQLNFTPTSRGPYVIQLHVSDGELTSEADYVVITGINTVPVAKPSYRKNTGGQINSVVLDGSFSSDRDGHSLSYHWVLADTPAGASAVIVSPHQAITELVYDKPGIYYVHLTVDDGFQESKSPMLKISTPGANTDPGTLPGAVTDPPHARAGNDIILFSTNKEYTLDANDSHDPNGLPMSYSWIMLSRPAGSGANLIYANSATPRFTADVRGSYVFQLTATNSAGLSSRDTVTVTDKRLGLHCADCHDGEIATGPLNHPDIVRELAWDCGRCHKISSWKTGALIPGNSLFDKVTQGSLGPVPQPSSMHSDVNSRCVECHLTKYEKLGNKHPSTSTRCNACHSITSWQTRQKMEHSKALGSCLNCHNTGMPPTHPQTFADCGLCHDITAWGTIFNNAHISAPKPCSSCHDVKLNAFHDFHDVFGDRCENCHTTTTWIPNTQNNHLDFFNECYYCHNGNITKGKGPTHKPVSNRCEYCHNIISFKPVYFFDHNETEARCVECHPDPTLPTPP
ncbi:MAG: PKD domain-containing protein [Gammaproteobacteria bacterium]|nr:PKD domain-containing protein [Gammaproteobacteria bacterium]